MIEKLKEAEAMLPELILNPDNWNSLDIDYHAPRVERLWMQYDETHRLYIHVIYPTDSPCLFHKHRWPAAFKMIDGEYEMGISYSEDELTTDEAYNLPIMSKFILHKGSYYEMLETNTLHYVKPLLLPSTSLMITGPLYKEAEFRKEVLNKKLEPLSDTRKKDILEYVDFCIKKGENNFF